jgi:hypothetical protein
LLAAACVLPLQAAAPVVSADSVRAADAAGTAAISGSTQTCARGSVLDGGACKPLPVPEHAVLDAAGTSWVCIPGYRRDGDACAAIAVPAHALLKAGGDGWLCEPGYRRDGDACTPAPPAKKGRLDRIEDSIIAARSPGGRHSLSGDSCQFDDRTGARVCVTVQDASLSCAENPSGDAYARCRVVVAYILATDYLGDAELGAGVDCNAQLRIYGGSYYSDSLGQTASRWYRLGAQDILTQAMAVEFPFGSDDITRAVIDSVDCSVNGVAAE